MIKAIGHTIDREIGIDQKYFIAVFDTRIGLSDVGTPRSQGFHLGSGQNQAGFIGLIYKIVKTRPTIFRDKTRRMDRIRQALNPNPGMLHGGFDYRAHGCSAGG